MKAPASRVPASLLTPADVRLWIEVARPMKGRFKIEPDPVELARRLDKILSLAVNNITVLIEFDFRQRAIQFVGIAEASENYSIALKAQFDVSVQMIADDHVGRKRGTNRPGAMTWFTDSQETINAAERLLSEHFALAVHLGDCARQRAEFLERRALVLLKAVTPAGKPGMGPLVQTIAKEFAEATGLPAALSASGPAGRFTKAVWSHIAPHLPARYQELSIAAYRRLIAAGRREKST